MADKHLFKFGDFVLCVEERSLRRGDKNIALTPKMYDLLLVLIQNPNRIVEKDFLLRSVWPDSFVEEGNITFNIRQLRKALGDNVQDPIYIETIPRRGYRFVAEVTNADADDRSIETPANGEEVSHQTRWLTSRPTLAVSVFVLLAAVMGSALWLSRGPGVQGAPILSAPFASEKLTTDGQVTHAVITPDGKTVVYSHRSGKKQSLWLRQLDTSNNIQIIPPSEAFFGGLAVSPDGNNVYITRGTLGPGRRQLDVYRLPIVGGVPQKVVGETQGWISVSPDGEKISYVRCYYKDDEFCSLWVADAADGKNERMLASRPRPQRIADNKISPDGHKVAFAVGQSWTGSNEFHFMEVDIETGAEREITPQKFFNINYIAWLPDQSGWLITALKLPDKNYRIWKVSNAGEISKLTADSETYSRLSLDAKARLLVSTRIEADFKLNLYQTDDPTAAPKVLADGASSAFAPDKKIYYSTRMSGDSEVWSINMDGTDQRQLTNDPADDFAAIISPDNRSVFFSSNRSGELHVWRMAADGTNQTQMTTQEGGFPLQLSPDGQWLYYRSGLNGNLRRVSITDGKEELVYGSQPGVDFALAPDTTRVALTQQKDNEYTFSVVSLADNQVEKTFKPAVPATRPAYVIWSHDGNDLVYVLEDQNSENRTLWFQGMSDTKPRKIADLGNTDIFELSGFALSYDTKNFVVAQGTWNHNAVLIKGLKP